MDLAASFGLFVMPIKFKMNASGLGSGQGDFNFTAPLPAFGLRGDFAITPRWMLRTNIDFFYLEYQNFRGSLVDTRVAVEYNPWEHFGFGLGFDNFRVGLKAEDKDYPSVNFQGDDRMDLAGSFGLFVMPITFDMNAPGLGSSEGDFSFTAPLPAFGLRGDFAITPRWMLRTNFDFFYLEYESFRGALLDARVAVEYNPWDHFGFGLGLDSFKLKLSAEDTDYPSVDFQGNIKSQFFGVQLYARYFF